MEAGAANERGTAQNAERACPVSTSSAANRVVVPRRSSRWAEAADRLHVSDRPAVRRNFFFFFFFHMTASARGALAAVRYNGK